MIVDKPAGWTSHDVVKKIKGRFRLSKAGHAGTLDPNATGVLVLCLGYATRFVRFLPCDPKEYQAEMILGIKTDTLDITGTVLAEEASNITLNEVKKVAKQFLGAINQIPPMVSAVKVKGKALYLHAREGKTIDRQPRDVEIINLTIQELLDGRPQKVLFKVLCSKGTYIRSLCDDMGEILGCGACLGKLVRLNSGVFRVEDSLSMDEVLKLSITEFEKILMPLTEALKNYQIIWVEDRFKARFLNGGFLVSKMVDIRDQAIGKGEKVRILDRQNEFLGLAQTTADISQADCGDPDRVILKSVCVIPNN